MSRILFALAFGFCAVFGASSGQAASVKVAAIHFRPELGDVSANRSRLLALNEEAARAGAKIIVNTEMATSGYSIFSRDDMSKVAEEIPGPTTRAFGDLAKRNGVYIAVGLPEFDPVTNQYFNSAAFIGPDGMVVGTYRKRNSLIEASYNAVATGPVPTFDTPYGRVSIVICADLFYPHFARLAAVAGTDILLAPANTGISMPFLSQRARENDMSVIVANRYGKETKGTEVDAFTEDSFTIPSPMVYDFSYDSLSGIVQDDGTPLAAWSDPADGVVYGDLAIRPAGTFPAVRRPDLYTILNQDTLEDYTFRQLGLPKPMVTGLAAADLGAGVHDPADVAKALDKASAKARSENIPLGLFVLPYGVFLKDDPVTLNELSLIVQNSGVDVVVSFREGGPEAQPTSILFATDSGKVTPYRYVRTHRLPNEHLKPGEHFLIVDRPYGRLSLLQGPDLLAPETSMVMEKLGVDVIAVAADMADPSADTLWRTRAADYLNIVVANASGDEGVFLGGYPAPPSESIAEGMAFLRADSGQVRTKKEPRHIDVSPLLVECSRSRC
ncbi:MULTISPECIES: nitrilase-related carbon-nitrogen hydrolase [unclassified Rhizobium]|uniref:nitrilase-related carbon-nitrogen hydrolase n=1 Tax=unclassified Rhizobium TaxID=2613769 RepID=UPI001C832766|nr:MULTISPECIES: nitrilase-related carbon-nitrogen hydrolase [unclassified Rhizobium]MBX5166775.1 hypothetical protein [Rhizobium sp. NZLR4b]MBX5186313.1 hypothetical protein [Rhizobium sp. NZLR5]